jgi:hypothetical protein
LGRCSVRPHSEALVFCATNGKFYPMRFGSARCSMALTLIQRISKSKPELSVIPYMYDEGRNPETVRGQKTKLITHASDTGAPVTVTLMPAAGTGGDLSRIFTSSVTLVPSVAAPAVLLIFTCHSVSEFFLLPTVTRPV